MSTTPETVGELFRSLGLTLTVRPHRDEDDAWACTLSRSDGRVFEIDSVSFFDVDPETGDEWMVEPSPSRVLSVLAGDVDDDSGGGDAAATTAAARAFLGDETWELLVRLDEAEME